MFSSPALHPSDGCMREQPHPLFASATRTNKLWKSSFEPKRRRCEVQVMARRRQVWPSRADGSNTPVYSPLLFSVTNCLQELHDMHLFPPLLASLSRPAAEHSQTEWSQLSVTEAKSRPSSLHIFLFLSFSSPAPSLSFRALRRIESHLLKIRRQSPIRIRSDRFKPWLNHLCPHEHPRESAARPPYSFVVFVFLLEILLS